MKINLEIKKKLCILHKLHFNYNAQKKALTQNELVLLVQKAGIEPARTLLFKGFSENPLITNDPHK